LDIFSAKQWEENLKASSEETEEVQEVVEEVEVVEDNAPVGDKDESATDDDK
jgi:hypothetical protein